MIEQLVDTRVLLQFLQDDPGLNDSTASLLESSDRRSLISLASLWEITQKSDLGLTTFSGSLHPDLPSLLNEEGFEILPIKWPVIRRSHSLPSHHTDPIDRLLIAEAIDRDIPIVSLDEKFDLYQITRLS